MATQGEKKEVVGNYELGRPLGRGSFSSVRECRNVQTGQRFAMKIIDKRQLVDHHMGEQINREISIMLKMSHRNVCGMKECFQTADKVYFVLDLVEGGELFDKIVQAKLFDEETGRKYFQQLILGLNYCHRHGIAHRDLKPENLLLDSSGFLKISDFGLSNIQRTSDSGKVKDSMLLQTVCGTPNYLAPEVLREQGYNGFVADMWSCGIILYVMLSGKLPFHDKNMGKLFVKIQAGEYKDQPMFTPESRNLIHHLLCVDPAQRFTIADVIKDPWFRVNWDDAWLKEGAVVPAHCPPESPKPATHTTSVTISKPAVVSTVVAAHNPSGGSGSGGGPPLDGPVDEFHPTGGAVGTIKNGRPVSAPPEFSMPRHQPHPRPATAHAHTGPTEPLTRQPSPPPATPQTAAAHPATPSSPAVPAAPTPTTTAPPPRPFPPPPPPPPPPPKHHFGLHFAFPFKAHQQQQGEEERVKKELKEKEKRDKKEKELKEKEEKRKKKEDEKRQKEMKKTRTESAKHL